MSASALKWAKVSIAWPMFQLCYGFGHLASLICNGWPDCDDGTICERLFSIPFALYQGGMRKSIFWDNWGELGFWREPEELPEEL